MIFRQLFDPISSTYTYILASGVGREAVVIDPVKNQINQYLKVISDLELKLLTAIGTHTHADHITALGGLRDALGCATVMGKHSKPKCVSYRVSDGKILNSDGIALRAIFTPGHTNESFSLC
jgi:sulfur dioxygenase